MKHKALIMALSFLSTSLFADSNAQLQQEINRLQTQTKQLQMALGRLQNQLVKQSNPPQHAPKEPGKVDNTPQILPVKKRVKHKPPLKEKGKIFHTSPLMVHSVEKDSEPMDFYPTALIADGRVLTYIAGTPIVTSPYLGAMPAFDGSDYIVNISSINRDLRLMEQRRRLYRAYRQIGYPAPNLPIIALSGKVQPVAMANRTYLGRTAGDLNLGSSELAVAAALNDKVEAYISLAYDESPPPVGPRVTNSNFSLNNGFVNIGNLDQSPLYFTAGQMYVPFGRYSSSMISSTLPLRLARTKSRPFILGYKSQGASGPYAAVYGFTSDTGLGHSGIGGLNLGYTLRIADIFGDIGVGYISSITDSTGMQDTGSMPFTTFGGFSSPTNGTELIHKIPGVDVHANLSFDRYSLTAEWVGAGKAFRVQDLSFNGRGAKPQAAQIEAGVTFMAFNKPASLGLGYQWSKETLALHLPHHRASAVFNISLWKDTIESLEYRHDVDFSTISYANGANSPDLINLNTIGTGKAADALIAQIGVFF
ncbi:MAG: LbtU family siderophore porin [Tatlockia sp.]|jgi:hypothetical protein